MTERSERRRGKARWQTARSELWGRLSRESQRMRLNPTPAERLLWERLRRRALGVHFRRQHVVDRFIVDFCCLEARLIVEVDGPIHGESTERDQDRDGRLTAEGYRVLRFQNDAVLEGIEAVIISITAALAWRNAAGQRAP